jgi:beta-glucosidase
MLEHYRRMLGACHENGLTPVVTYHHFTSPRWLIAAGGWEDPKTPERFARFCERATRYLGDLIGAGCTLNEPNLSLLLTKSGIIPPPNPLQPAPWRVAAAQALGITPERLVPFLSAASDVAVETILAAHRQSVVAIKAAGGDFPVGMTLALQDIQAGPDGEAMAGQMRQAINGVYLDNLTGDDFVGVQTYSRLRFGPTGPLPSEEGVELTQMHYEFWPEALEATIRYAIAVTGRPVLVTENGLGTDDDTRRIAYVQRALQGVANCLKDGLDVRGYIYWSAFDNYEWMLGYRPTFGLVAVDRETQERTVKPSARWLGTVARANGW